MKDNWQTKKLGEVCEKTGSISWSKFTNEKFQYIDLTSVSRESLSVVSSTEINARNAPSRAKQIVKIDDIIFGTTRPTLKRVAKIHSDLNNQICSTGFVVLRPISNLVLPNYIYYFVQSEDFIEQMSKLQRGANYPAVSNSDVKSQELLLPPIQEQERIVKILDEAFEKIDTAKQGAEKNLRDLKFLFESYLELTFKQYAADYEPTTLGDFCDIKHGYAFTGSQFKNNTDTDLPVVLTPGNFNEEGGLYFTAKNTKRLKGTFPKEFLFQRGDLVIVMTDLSSKMKILGNPAVIDSDDILHNQRIGKIIFKNNTLTKKFLFFYFLSRSFKKSVKSTSTGTMVRHTAPVRILKNQLPIPPISEQELVVKKFILLSEYTKKLEENYKQKIADLDELKKSVLSKAFAGEL